MAPFEACDDRQHIKAFSSRRVSNFASGLRQDRGLAYETCSGLRLSNQTPDIACLFSRHRLECLRLVAPDYWRYAHELDTVGFNRMTK